MLRVLAGEVVSPPPFWLMRQAGRYLPEYRKIRDQAGGFLDLCYSPDKAVEVTLQPIRHFGMDAAILFADILVIPDALGQDLRFAVGEGPLLDPIRDQAALGRLNPDFIDQKLDPIYETVSRLRSDLPGETTLIGFAGAPWTVATYMVEGKGSRDFTETKLWAYRDPDGFAKLIVILVEATIHYLRRQIDAGAEVIQIFDTWAGVLPAPEFGRWCIEPTAQIVAALKESHAEVPVIGFPRGAGLALHRYVAGTGVDAVSLDTGIPTEWAAKTLQPRIPVQGNLDPIMLVAGGEALDRAARQVLESLAAGPFVFNLGHGIIPETPPEHVAQLARIIRGWKG